MASHKYHQDPEWVQMLRKAELKGKGEDVAPTIQIGSKPHTTSLSLSLPPAPAPEGPFWASDPCGLCTSVQAQMRLSEAKVMLRRLWPMVKALREELTALEGEYARWAAQHMSAQRRLAQLSKRVIPPGVSGKPKEPKPEKHTHLKPKARPPSPEAKLMKKLKSISALERKKLLAELLELLEKEP